MNANWQKSLARRNAVGWLAVVALLAVSLQGATLISNWSTHRLGDEVAEPQYRRETSRFRRFCDLFLAGCSDCTKRRTSAERTRTGVLDRWAASVSGRALYFQVELENIELAADLSGFDGGGSSRLRGIPRRRDHGTVKTRIHLVRRNARRQSLRRGKRSLAGQVLRVAQPHHHCDCHLSGQTGWGRGCRRLRRVFRRHTRLARARVRDV